MAKKHFGRLLTLAAVAGAVAAGVSYFLQYKSFHKELNEDFHDFEDDFDDFDDTEEKDSKETTRSYVTLTPDHKTEETREEESAAVPEAENTEAPAEPAEGTTEESEAIPKPTVTVEEMTE